jgi:hypothetical protein
MSCGCNGGKRTTESVQQAAAEAQVRAEEARMTRGEQDARSAKNATANAST